LNCISEGFFLLHRLVKKIPKKKIILWAGDLAEDNFGPAQYSEESLVAASIQQVHILILDNTDTG
jgi:hypothetical protein